MPKPPSPTPDEPISPVDPTYIPFTTTDPDASSITIEDLPQKEPEQYRNIIEYMRQKMLAGEKIFPEAFALAMTGQNNIEADTYTITKAGAVTGLGGIDAGSQTISPGWSAPVDQGGAGSIIDYQVKFIKSGGILKVAEGTADNTDEFRTISVGVAGTYTVEVFAINEIGIGVGVAIFNVIVA